MNNIKCDDSKIAILGLKRIGDAICKLLIEKGGTDVL
jgi:Trk K+ transport system NAD-binding subunit